MTSQINTRVVKLFPRRIITPLAGALALVIGLSGGMLFFHVGEGLVKGLHEWLGMLFVAVMLIHMLSNWSSLSRYFNQGVARIGVLTIILATGLFLGGATLSQQAGPSVVFKALEEAPVVTLAQLFQVDEDRLMQALNGQGVIMKDNSQTLAEVALSDGLDKRETLQKLLASVGAIQQPN
ncbi:DUF4405 domain-containing protein [Sedimenticola selenatireducens]|uniref:DUF4405 domain-containing protein n=1 Tax=Sedimenticola selenatireducens TaxID=191960 RepID=A0A558DXT9_9GAMM|nr:DUF4405 domain-containing protein [Sedimenticola selenatireducens]TVO70971.1 DUF4405 domain-containing protein [Sedimenticola selenatireducens]TVT65837.1 MAG: DUF4405 domain-containing protein [Sedimenticola selenatireducens]